MKYFIITTLMLLSVTSGAQVKISGHITDNKNRSVAGASIVLLNTYDGATSDSLGNYTFSTEEQGIHKVEVSVAGYNGVVQDIHLTTSSITLNFILKEQVTELKAVVISAGSFEASDKNKCAVLTP